MDSCLPFESEKLKARSARSESEKAIKSSSSSSSSFFLTRSKKTKTKKQVEGDSCPEYMAKAEAALRSEEGRVDAYLHASSRSRLMAGAEQALLARHADALLSKEGSGVAALLADGRRDDLARMYRLFVRVPRGLDPVAAAFRVHVEGKVFFFSS